MGIAEYVLQKTLSTNGVSQLLWQKLRWLLVRALNDPACSTKAHGRTLRLPLSHELPTYLRLLPLYDSLPGRLSSFLHAQAGPALKFLDVGANIGDSLAALYQDQRDTFLAIEPDPKFNRYLRANWHTPNVKILDLVCFPHSGTEKFELDEKFGTATFYKSARGVAMPTITIDDLLTENLEFSGPHLIKIDTDGNDFAVLAGAKQTLAGQPAVLFECDVFGNTRYVEECLQTLAMFRAAGYQSMLVYEKFGYPLGRHGLGDLKHFRELLFYQLNKRFIYFDILLMKEHDLLSFAALEKAFFLDALPDARLRATAQRA